MYKTAAHSPATTTHVLPVHLDDEKGALWNGIMGVVVLHIANDTEPIYRVEMPDFIHVNCFCIPTRNIYLQKCDVK